MFNTDQLRILERSLDASMLRQRTIANNIANMDTPYFKSKQVVFEELLQQELNGTTPTLSAYRTDPRHIPFGNGSDVPAPQIVSNPNAFVQNNGNDVDVEYEMNRLAKNQIWYNGLVQLTNGYFSKLRSVIDGGGR
ncbi:flagellar basal body rod protein FlgB [Brevibacillus sp. SYP-B805]|uniref:flagellar basal body rod protein FlgB n=1 Tax=Brevibacillus sp. SYP-B805 TaxID=1578199 RepID=UPI0013EA95BE|nr:flagellar basal body rod protein FlgB [Brevibacillus sp. SYP-B805]NGQ94002.1 flagellar basal body rod protein FlgB [Brevibacillus sp. SYP-B805]